jgi:hypothetical protein
MMSDYGWRPRMQEIPESVQQTFDAISAELRFLANLEEVTRDECFAAILKSWVSPSP